MGINSWFFRPASAAERNFFLQSSSCRPPKHFSKECVIKRLVVGPIDTNCYLLFSRGETAVIDPGGSPDLILNEIKKLNGVVKYIINTHFHDDHTGEAEGLRRATGAKILIHKAEKEIVDFSADRYLREGDIIAVGAVELKVIHTPGHTPGGICLLDQKQKGEIPRFIFTGDTLFLNGTGRTDLEWGSEEDMERSLNRLAGIIKPGMLVYPGHGDCSRFYG